MNSRSRNRFFTALKSTATVLLLLPAALAFCASPTADSVTPSSGTGTVQTFSFAFSDADGVSDLSWVYAGFSWNSQIFTGIPGTTFTCAVYYHPADNLIYLGNDDNTATLGPGAVGSAGTLSNNQCTISVGESSTSVSGNTLTLHVAIGLHVVYALAIVPSNVYMYAQDKENNVSGVQTRGSWTAVDGPHDMSVSPSAGSGSSQTFALTYSRPTGAADLTWVFAYFQPSGSNTDAVTCHIWYHPSDNLIYLADDSFWANPHSRLVGPGAVGQPGTLRNNGCMLDVGASSVSRTFFTLTLNAALSFEGQPEGPRDVFMYFAHCDDRFCTGLEGVHLGTYTVDFGPFHAESVKPVFDASYHPNRTTFTVKFSDENGGSAITFAYILFTPNNLSSNACPIYVHLRERTVYLGNDAHDVALGPGEMGSPGTLSNSQCTLDVGDVSTTVGPTTLEINLPITFASAFDGPLDIITYAEDDAGLNTGFQYTTSYTVSPPVAPTYGFGTQNGVVAPTVYARFADANGNQDLKTLYILVAPSLNTDTACYMRYEKADNALYLSDDAGDWRGPGQPTVLLPGGIVINSVPGSLTNNECTIDTGNSLSEWPINPDPTLWDLYVPITQYAAPSGTVLNIYMNAVDNEGNSGGWVPKSTWIVP